MSEQPQASGGSQAAAAPGGSGAGSNGASAQAVEMEFSAFRVVLPAEIADQVDLTRVDEYCLRASAGDLELFELACYDQHEATKTEWRHRVYSLGDAVDPAGVHEVRLTVNYITADGKHIAHWGDATSTELALESITGFSDAQLISCIEVRAAADAGMVAWEECTPMLLSDDGASYTGSSSANAGSSYNASVSQAYGDESSAPFWGVWASASKSLDECEGFVADVRSAGWPEAAVYQTTDWSDLNSEHWYVVSLQRCDSQSAAEDAATRAQKDGYDGAYARYTGSYVSRG